MPFEDVVGSVTKWNEAASSLAALGAELAILHGGVDAPPVVVAALREVTEAAGLSGLAELPPPQAQSAMAIIRTFLHQAVDVVDHPERAGGWTFTDTTLLDGWGRASMMVPMLIVGAHPDLASVSSFLDVGTGVGFLAITATNIWPGCSVVGLDTWETSLERAQKNVADAGVADRVTLRNQDLAQLDDVDSFDCAWVPSFFISEAALQAGLSAVSRALRPGGRVVVAVNRPAATPLAAALAQLEQVRSGGSNLTPAAAIDLLTDAGFDEVGEAPPGPAPIALVLGRRPS